jgi:hypothetical protein
MPAVARRLTLEESLDVSWELPDWQHRVTAPLEGAREDRSFEVVEAPLALISPGDWISTGGFVI